MDDKTRAALEAANKRADQWADTALGKVAASPHSAIFIGIALLAAFVLGRWSCG